MCQIRGLINHLCIAVGVEMTTLDNVSNIYSKVLHVVTFALNVQSNIKQMILYNMEFRNCHLELGVK